ncbi:MAG: hypothetical protein IJ374_04925, partial [Lachnospiraceae bacterium]|nr:hypothetical protein [Lachnospiraceae bacterium]
MIAGLLALVLGVSGISVPVPALGSNVWPQKSTAPFYCLDGGKGWKASDRYEIYKYDTLPSALTEIQARRLFWAYPSNWNALKEAAAKYDTELYAAISTTVSGPNIVKKVKDDKSTKFAWVADNPEIEARAIGVLEKMAGKAMTGGKDAPAEIRDATSEEQAVSITVPAFNSGPASLNTEFKLDSEFIRDIAKIEAQSVWDNGSTGGDVGWLDASQEKNIVKAVMGDELYEITWSGDSIKIHNNGSAVANENAIGSEMSDEERYNKTTVRYKITMRENSGWYTEGSWNDNYLREWMDFKACTNSPGHQRLYKADIRIVPSDQVFYLVIGQGESADLAPAPEYGTETVDVEFQIFKHEETFESTYNVKLKKIDDETEMPLKGSQFYLYEAFESDDMAGEDEWNGGLSGERLSFRPWSGFQIFSEGTTDEKGELVHTDSRSYIYSKTYCDGHKLPDWVTVKEEDDDETESEDEESEGNEEEEGKDSAKDANRNAAMQWMELVEACNAAAEGSGGTHFHWLVEEGSLEEVQGVLDSGEAEELIGSAASSGLDSQTAFEQSGCKDDCEATYENFINLRFSYTWKEIQARTGYILHGVHEDDRPIEVISTNASEAGADAVLREGSSDEIEAHVWYTGNNEERRSRQMQAEILLDRHVEIEQIEGMNAGKDFYEKEQEPGETVALMQVTLEAAKGKVWNASDSNSGTDFNPTTSSNATTDSNAASNSNAKSEIKAKRRGIFSAMADYLAHVFEMDDGDESEDDYDDEWESSGSSGAFEMYLMSAEEDRIHHIEKGSTDIFSYPNDTDPNRDYWLVRNHRTEGEIHINKRDMDLYKGESGVYSAYGDTEGDGTLEGAIYGLFAAEDILHPDSDLLSHSEFSNTGFVYRKNDLVSVAETDSYGNASFENFTVAPGMTYDYE